jgi:MoaA/NifB/PqqE/SkfB family radical SAM enzyme
MARLIEDFSHIGLKAITFSGGGEPLVNPATRGAMQLAKDLGIQVGLITNGTLLTDPGFFIDICTWVRVSLDASCMAQHMLTHGAGPADFKKICLNLVAMADYKGRYGGSCTIGAGYLTAPRTMMDIYSFAQLCAKLGIDYCQYRPYHQVEILQAKDLAAWEEIFYHMKIAKQDFTTDKFKVLATEGQFKDVLEKNWGRTYHRCHAHAFETVIGATGEVFFCCAYKEDPKMVLGNIKDESFIDIWKGHRRLELHTSIDTHECTPLCQLNQANKSLQAYLVLGELPTDDAPDHVNFI